MIVAILVIAHGGGVHYRGHDVRGNDRPAGALLTSLITGDRTGRRFQNRQGLPRVAAGHAHDVRHGFVSGLDFTLESAFIG